MFFRSMPRPLVAALFILLLVSAPVAAAVEPFATHPVLPSGYSSIKVFDRNGRFAGRILSEKRYWVPLERIPVFLQNAVVAVEDSRFYQHSGIDVRGIARALVKDVVKRRLAEGGSTITQQLIKNRYLTAEKTIDRKVKEGLLAIEFEKKYSKRQILEMYFNEIYYGNGAWGIGQAARLYFDKNPEELTDAECALLAGVPKNPGRYNPLGKAADVGKRRSIVLRRMADLDMISRRDEQRLKAGAISVTRKGEVPHYLSHIRGKLVDKFGPQIVEQGGLEVTAGMDLNLQKAAETALREGVKKVSPQLQGALLCVDTATGDVLAAVGGVDAAAGSYNRAFFARRQPGSAIKPLLYAAALEKGFTPGSMVDDTPVAYSRGSGGGMWKPANYGGEFHGELTLREALAHSSNVVAVKLLDAVGVPALVELAAKAGLTLRPESGLSLALGTDDASLNELVQAYTPFAAGGMRVEPRTIIRIWDRNRNQWTDNPPTLTPAIPPGTSYLVARMLEDVMTYGTARSLGKFSSERPMAGKTGTTDDYRDAWFIGFTPQMVTGVWVGYDKPQPGGAGFTGGRVAAPIWERFMRSAVSSLPAAGFPRPEGVAAVVIDPATGSLATDECPKKREEFYLAGSEPQQYCSRHGGGSLPPPATRETEEAKQ